MCYGQTFDSIQSKYDETLVYTPAAFTAAQALPNEVTPMIWKRLEKMMKLIEHTSIVCATLSKSYHWFLGVITWIGPPESPFLCEK